MDKKTENIHPDQWLKDLTPEPELHAFKPEEMLTCEKCGRTSPPTRLECMYCGTRLPISELHDQYLKLSWRKLEEWEKGYNVIFIPDGSEYAAEQLTAVSRFLGIETEETQKIIESKTPLPVARVEAEPEAALIEKKLAENKMQSRILTDQQLDLETPVRRLRGIEFFDDKLQFVLFNTSEIVEISAEDLALIVRGAIFGRKIESTSQLKRKGEGKNEDLSEISNDEIILDMYTGDDETGYRIETKGFDFSSLGAEKSLLAGENISRLAQKILSLAPSAKYNDDYSRVRAELGKIWETEEKTIAGELSRATLSSYKRKHVITTNNLRQFTRYSRMQRYIL